MSQPQQGAAQQTKRKRSKRKANPTGEMTLVEHLKELRRRIIISLSALVVATVLGFIWYQHAPFGTIPLGELLRGPYCNLPSEMRISTGDGQCRLLATSPFEMLMLRMKIGGLAGLVLASPIWLYQLWAFITPGLLRKERRWTFAFVTAAVTLFVLGAVLAYVVLSVGLEFLMGIGEEFQASALTGERYFSFVLNLILIFGISFEVPLLIVMLNIIGLLEYAQIKDKRHIIIVGLFVFAAFMTPGQDPFSMVALALSMSLLVELSLQFCRINDKRLKREHPEWANLSELDDDEASGPIAHATPVSRPAPIADSTPQADTPRKHGTSESQNRDPFGDVL